MNLDKKGTFKLLGIIFLSILFYAAITNLSIVISLLETVLKVIAPIMAGIAIAFLLNMPLKFFECRVFKKLTYYSKSKVWKKIKRPVCLALSVILVLAFITVLIVIIAPQLVEALKSFFGELPGYMDALDIWLNDMIERLHLPMNDVHFNINWNVISTKVLELFNDNQQSITDMTIGVILDIGTGLFNLVFGFIFAVYILASKERLSRSARRLAFSVFKQERAKSLLKFSTLANKAFTGFVTGQTIEMLTIGVLCFIGMLILKMPYALLVSVIIAITAFIPVFGPIIGTVIGAFIILIVSPMKAIWFVVFILILQQIESNVIYPKIMGKSVGLPGLWVLVAVTVFGGLWGILGIVISIPICSVLYALFDSWMSKRLIERNILHNNYEVDHNEVPYENSFFKFAKRRKNSVDEEEKEESTEETK